MSAPIPVTVIGGYLGSGKTTLLNQLLRQAHSRRTAVLVNDFGEIGIDGDLIAQADGDTITLTNGCVCCAIGGDLMAALWAIRDRDVPPEHVIIEASGIADPAPIAHHALTPGFDLDGVVVLLDAETVRRRERHPIVGRTIRRQLAAADVLVLNKIDLVSSHQLDQLDEWVTRIAPEVPVIHASEGRVPLESLMGFDLVGFDLVRFDHGERPLGCAAGHSRDYVTVSFTVDEPLRRGTLEALLDDLPPGVLRVKGILRLAETPDQRTVVHLVASRRTLTTDSAWRTGEAGRLVVIALAGTPGLDRLAAQLIGS